MTDLLGALDRFLRRLAEVGDPDAVARAVVEEFRDPLGLRTAIVFAARPPLLVVYAIHGFLPEETTGFESMPLEADYPVARAIREGAVIADTLDTALASYAGTSRRNSRFSRVTQRLGSGYSVCAPLVSGARPVGGLGVLSVTDRPWTTMEIAAFEAIASALSMWLTHPDSGLPFDHDGDRPELTTRQKRILALVAQGRTNAAIGRSLGYSESTVKQELNAILRALDATSRTGAVARGHEFGLIAGIDG